eukprot:2064086-Pyramimonas_sp.AAC.2
MVVAKVVRGSSTVPAAGALRMTAPLTTAPRFPTHVLLDAGYDKYESGPGSGLHAAPEEMEIKGYAASVNAD